MYKNFSKIRSVVAVASGKGGVGKSSVTVNLALALQKAGYAVGVLDADLYGPSLGKMLPLDVGLKKSLDEQGAFYPGECRGVKVFSLSHVRSEEVSLSVRAPIVNELILQSVRDVLWGELDYLLVDFPPGTGDIQLTLLQNIIFAGAVLVTTPQEVSVLDVKKGAQMFFSSGVPVLGIVENMSHFADEATKMKHYLFGQGGGRSLAELFDIPFLGEIPVEPVLCRAGDEGKNFLEEGKDLPAALVIEEVAGKLRSSLFDLEALKEESLESFELVWEEK